MVSRASVPGRLTAHPSRSVPGRRCRATAEAPLQVPENAVVVPGARAVTKGKAAEWQLSLYTPVIVTYRDEKTDRGIELENMLR
jgi:2,3,4,5-tetrahydropyridine-2-carboxylate N-succinyltransferase